MSLHKELEELQDRQVLIDDEYRLFHDGTIKMASLTDSGRRGWYVVAKSIPGMSFSFRQYFRRDVDGFFLRVESLRDAMNLRDKIFATVIEARVHRRIENEASNLSINQSSRTGSLPTTF